MHTDSSRRVRHQFNDKIDQRILSVLQRDGRISNVQLAERVHLSPSAVFERVRRLKREGYILGYQARLNHGKLGMEMVAFVEVHLDRMNSSVMQRFESAIREHDRILECHMIAGTFDYLLKVLACDMDACHALVASVISRLPGVRHARAHAGVETSFPDPASGSGAEPAVDDVDIRLLRLLQADGRCSTQRLAEELGIPSGLVRERIGRLCRKGFILGYAAVLNDAKLRPGSLVFAAIRTSADAHLVAPGLRAAAQDNDEILECHEVTGNYDYLLKLRVPDMRRHSELMEAIVWPLPGVNEVRTYAVIDEVKSTTRIPV